MKKFIIATLLLTSAGCANQHQHQLDQSLLLQENQRLEEALFVTHAQLVDLKRENESLKALQTSDDGGKSAKPILPAIRSRRTEPTNRDDYDEAPKFEAPKITIPENAPASDSLPDSLKGRIPPRITPPSRQYSTQEPSEIVFPVLPSEKTGDLVPPAWSPTR